jgi:hypothetical protein
LRARTTATREINTFLGLDLSAITIAVAIALL